MLRRARWDRARDCCGRLARQLEQLAAAARFTGRLFTSQQSVSRVRHLRAAGKNTAASLGHDDPGPLAVRVPAESTAGQGWARPRRGLSLQSSGGRFSSSQRGMQSPSQPCLLLVAVLLISLGVLNSKLPRGARLRLAHVL
jgi:hypothetical protein